jgi:biotin transport system substrate-specific component
VTALVSASAWIQIPVQPVPITLQVFFVVLAALLLRPGWAFGSMAVYLALGAAGVPVFSGGQGGLGVLAGPTGGYLFGFLIGAGLASSLRAVLIGVRLPAVLVDACAAVIAIAAIYTVGAAQLSMVLGLSLDKAIAAGVMPFLVPDTAKAAAAVAVAAAVRRAIR